MTYLFKCRETGDLLMLHADGDAVLRIIGRAPAAKGIIETAALPAAIALIEREVAQEELRLAKSPEAAKAEDSTSEAHGDVSLRQRTWPLLQMMKSAHAAEAAVTWGL